MAQLGDEIQLPKKFYKDCALAEDKEQGFVLTLDGRPARTPRQSAIASKSKMIADEIVQEWQRVETHIDTTRMPVTKLLVTAIDLAEQASAEWREQILSFLKSDLLCYRADEPMALRERQQALWDPYLTQFASTYGHPLKVTSGIMAVSQPQEALTPVQAHLDTLPSPLLLSAKAATEITGSAVLGLALLRAPQAVDALWQAARVDEDFQIERWGEDEEASIRAQGQLRDLRAAGLFAAGYADDAIG